MMDVPMMTAYRYKGYVYTPWDDHEDDNIKRFHDVVGPAGENLMMPCSPYHHPTEEFFRLWVDAGCPFPPRQRITLDELKEIVFNSITEEALTNDERA